jgi:hypothetical protein
MLCLAYGVSSDGVIIFVNAALCKNNFSRVHTHKPEDYDQLNMNAPIVFDIPKPIESQTYSSTEPFAHSLHKPHIEL